MRLGVLFAVDVDVCLSSFAPSLARRQGFLLGSTLVQDVFFGFPHSSSTRVLSVGCQRLSVGFLCLVLFGSSVGVAVFRDVVVQCVVSWG